MADRGGVAATTTAVSFGTTAWLATLLEAGWDLKVVEHHTPGAHAVLRLVEDDFDALELRAPDLRTVGVLAVRDGDGVFVPMDSEEAARGLLARVMEEAPWA